MSKKLKRKLKELNKRVDNLEKQLFPIEVNDPQIIGNNELITNPFGKVVGSCEKIEINPPEQKNRNIFICF